MQSWFTARSNVFGWRSAMLRQTNLTLVRCVLDRLACARLIDLSSRSMPTNLERIVRSKRDYSYVIQLCYIDLELGKAAPSVMARLPLPQPRSHTRMPCLSCSTPPGRAVSHFLKATSNSAKCWQCLLINECCAPRIDSLHAWSGEAIHALCKAPP